MPVVVDQPTTIGALAVAVAQHLGISAAYLPGLTMLRIADMYPGTAKTDDKDAFILSDAVRTMPHTLRNIMVSDEDETTLGMLTGFDLEWLLMRVSRDTGMGRFLFLVGLDTQLLTGIFYINNSTPQFFRGLSERLYG